MWLPFLFHRGLQYCFHYHCFCFPFVNNGNSLSGFSTNKQHDLLWKFLLGLMNTNIWMSVMQSLWTQIKADKWHHVFSLISSWNIWSLAFFYLKWFLSYPEEIWWVLMFKLSFQIFRLKFKWLSKLCTSLNSVYTF